LIIWDLSCPVLCEWDEWNVVVLGDGKCESNYMKFLDLIVAVMCNADGLSILESFFALFACPAILRDSAKAVHDLQSCHLKK
jgi:hypothetical protein